jgi:hypothetical protein
MIAILLASVADGAALSDVTVQAESAGQYRIEDLRPGVYTLTFMRDGFPPQVRKSVGDIP